LPINTTIKKVTYFFIYKFFNMKSLFILCLALIFSFCAGSATAEAPPEPVQQQEIVSPTKVNTSALAFQYVQQLTAAGCISWTGNPTGALTVTIVDCECFDDPHSAASVKLKFITSRPNITVVNPC
jgi:hypothetical protein